MEKKIYTIREILKSKGYAMNRSWTVETENFKLYNCKWGGKMMLDIFKKGERETKTTEFDAVIAELENGAKGRLWFE